MHFAERITAHKTPLHTRYWRGLSIGYILRDYEYDKQFGIYKLKDIDLWEVSLVTFPANDEARVSEVKSQLESGEVPSPFNVERALREALGFSRTQAKGFMVLLKMKIH